MSDRKDRKDDTENRTVDKDNRNLQDKVEDALIDTDEDVRRNAAEQSTKDLEIASNAPDITDPDEAEDDKNLQDKTEEALINLEEKIRKDNQRSDRREGHIKSSNAPNITDTPPRKKE